MTCSDNPDVRFDPLKRASRYDLVLTVIPLAFLFGLLAAGALPVSTDGAMAAAGTVGLLVVADALFLNPPEPDDAG